MNFHKPELWSPGSYVSLKITCLTRQKEIKSSDATAALICPFFSQILCVLM